MEKLKKALRGCCHLCFVDFEATQYSHEMIAFGAVFASIKRDFTIKKKKEPIKYYVKSRAKVGRFVEDLTGINKDILEKEGISFADALQIIKKYCGMYFKKTIFVTFGNHDVRILNQSASYNIGAQIDLVKQITKNHFDFQLFISEFIKDEHNNPYSLEKYVDFFGLSFDGTAHDPKYDAVNLMNLYEAFLEQKQKVINSYIQVLARDTKIPLPVRKVINKLAMGEDVCAKDYKKIVEEYFE